MTHNVRLRVVRLEKKSKNCMLNKVILESATDIIQKLWDIEWYGTVAKDNVM